MSAPLPLQNQFNAGMKRDGPRNRMIPGSAWNLQDVVVDYGAPARERSGWGVATSGAFLASTQYLRGGIFATFSPTTGADPQNLCFDQEGRLYKILGEASSLSKGICCTIAQNPVFHGATAASAAVAVYTGLVIIPDATMTLSPRKYDGQTVSALGGNPPRAKYASVYKDFTVLGHGYVGSTYYPNRIWWSPPGDPDVAVSGTVTAWDTTDSWIDFSLPVLGFGSTKNALLVFHSDRLSRIRGSSPPPEEDMVVDDPFLKIGLLDPFSITEHEDVVYWCAPEGVFSTDGVSLNNLTLKGGMLRYWLDLVASSTSTWTFATGIIRDKLVITVMDGTTFKDAFLVDISSFAWTRLSNFKAISFWDGLYGTGDEEYFAVRTTPIVGRTDPIFRVGNSSFKNDGDNTAVASVVETAFFELGPPGLKVVKSLFAGYELTDFNADNPRIDVSYIKTPEETTYTAMGSFTESGTYTRKRLPIGGRMPGIAFKFQRVNAGDMLGYDIAVEMNPLEASKRV